jgi:hypothetical protein
VSKTVTAPASDRSMWRKLLRVVHPDAAGDDELFVWCRNLQELIDSSYAPGSFARFPTLPPDDVLRSDEIRRRAAQERHYQRSQSFAKRVPFDPSVPFADLSLRAAELSLASEVDEPYAGLLRLAAACEEDGADVGDRFSGASYKALGAIGHACSMDKAARSKLYRIAESVPLSMHHARFMLSKLREEA